MAEQKLGNPAVVGLAGFGMTTLVLQFHNVGWMSSIGPVVWLGLIFGGTAQLIAGLQEMKTGNNFGYCAFTSYGAFWIALCFMLLGNKYDLFKAGTEDIGWFLVGWTLFTAILWIGSLRIVRWPWQCPCMRPTMRCVMCWCRSTASIRSTNCWTPAIVTLCMHPGISLPSSTACSMASTISRNTRTSWSNWCASTPAKACGASSI